VKKDRSAWPSDDKKRGKAGKLPAGQTEPGHRPPVPPPLKRSKTPTQNRRGR
jgi:hypothetical protein